MLVTDRQRCQRRSLESQIQRAVLGGLRLIQFRERELSEAERATSFARLAAVAPEVRWLINDDAALARAHDCGLHRPASRPAAGSESVPRPYGRSVHDECELARALDDGVDYLVVGTIYPTESKPGGEGRGVEWIARAHRLAGARPVFAIGGVTPERVPELLSAGAYGVAVCDALLNAADPAVEARRLIEALGDASYYPSSV